MYPGQAEKMADRMLTFDRTDALHLVNMTAGFDADAGIASVCETVYGMQWALVTVFAGCLTLFGVACYVFYLRTKYYLMETLADLKRASPLRRRRGSPRDCLRSRPCASHRVGSSSSSTSTSTTTGSRRRSSQARRA